MKNMTISDAAPPDAGRTVRLKWPSYSLAAFGALYVVLLPGFLFLTTAQHRAVFYLSLICGLVYLVRSDAVAAVVRDNKRLLALALLFLGYNSLSMLWSPVLDAEHIFSAIKIPVFIAVFCLTAACAIRRQPALAYLSERVYILAALLVGAFVLFSQFDYRAFLGGEVGYDLRLHGLGRAENSNIFGMFIAVALLLCLFPTRPAAATGPVGKALHILGWMNNVKTEMALAVFFAVCLLLTGWRGGMIAALAAIALTSLLQGRKKQIVLCLLVFAAGGLVLLTVPDIWHNLVMRGDTYRFEIWAQALDLIRQAPVFGHGIGAEYKFTIQTQPQAPQSSTHNIFLGTLLYGGAAGLLILLVFAAYTAYRALRLGRNTGVWLPFALLCFGAVTLQVSGHTLFLNLNKEWWLSWVPLTYLLSFVLPARQAVPH
jgi:O-antigen ligase